MKKLLLYFCLGLSSVAHAAKFTVSLTTPSTNTNGTPLTDLSSIEIEVGTCTAANGFGTLLEAALIAESQTGVSKRYPLTTTKTTGQAKVCIRAFAYNAAGAKSDSSNVAVKVLIPNPGRPVTLDQPVILNFN